MVLSDHTIKEELAAGRIVIDPLGDGCIQPASVDLHLDQNLLVFRNSRRPFIDVRQDMSDLTEMEEIDRETPFMLHPGEFVLASTLEEIELPDDLVARLEGKSSLGRIGLAHPLHRWLRGPRMEGPPDLGAEQRVQPAGDALLWYEDRPALLPETDDGGRRRLRLA